MSLSKGRRAAGQGPHGVLPPLHSQAPRCPTRRSMGHRRWAPASRGTATHAPAPVCFAGHPKAPSPSLRRRPFGPLPCKPSPRQAETAALPIKGTAGSLPGPFRSQPASQPPKPREPRGSLSSLPHKAAPGPRTRRRHLGASERTRAPPPGPAGPGTGGAGGEGAQGGFQLRRSRCPWL